MSAVQLDAGSIHTIWVFSKICKSLSVVEIFFSPLHYGERESLGATALNCLYALFRIFLILKSLFLKFYRSERESATGEPRLDFVFGVFGFLGLRF